MRLLTCMACIHRCAGGTASYGTGPVSADRYYEVSRHLPGISPASQLYLTCISCIPVASRQVSRLVGVACVDMSLIADEATLRAHPGWADFEARIESERKA